VTLGVIFTFQDSTDEMLSPAPLFLVILMEHAFKRVPAENLASQPLEVIVQVISRTLAVRRQMGKAKRTITFIQKSTAAGIYMNRSAYNSYEQRVQRVTSV
jgi:hypothetical protein